MGAIGFSGLATAEVMYFEGRKEAVGFQPFMVDHFEDFDADRDGMVSMAEAKPGLAMLGMSDDESSEAFFKRQGFMPRRDN